MGLEQEDMFNLAATIGRYLVTPACHRVGLLLSWCQFARYQFASTIGGCMRPQRKKFGQYVFANLTQGIADGRLVGSWVEGCGRYLTLLYGILLGSPDFSSSRKAPPLGMLENDAFIARVIMHEELRSPKHVRFESVLGRDQKSAVGHDNSPKTTNLDTDVLIANPRVFPAARIDDSRLQGFR